MDVTWYPTVILISMSLMTNDAYNFFMFCWLLVYLLWKKILYESSEIFNLIICFIFCLNWVVNCLIYLDTRPLSNICFANVFCQYVECHFLVLNMRQPRLICCFSEWKIAQFKSSLTESFYVKQLFIIQLSICTLKTCSKIKQNLFQHKDS